MTGFKLVHFTTVAIYAFLPWVIVIFLLSLLQAFPRPLFLFIHYILNLIAFGVVFRSYYQTRPKARPFVTTVQTVVALIVFEVLFWNFFANGWAPSFTFVDWIFPLFLVATIVYAVAKRPNVYA